MTDDARIVESGACQLETWTRLGPAGNEYWALPACNATGNLELTAGVGVLPRDEGKPEDTVVQIQGKTLFRDASPGNVGVGLALGTALRGRRLPDTDQLGEVFGYVPATLTSPGERVAVNTNLGVRYRGDGQGPFMLWGVGVELLLLGPVTGIAECYGDVPDASFMQAGLRVWLRRDVVQLDATYGRRLPGDREDDWATVGLRLLSSPFIPRAWGGP